MAKKQTIPFDGQGREIFHTLLSYLITDTDATQYLWGVPLTELALPEDMEFEKLTIDCIYTLIANGANPTFKAVAERLRGRYQIEDAHERLGEIHALRQLSETSDFQGVVRQAYGNFLTWWDDTHFGYTLGKALDVWNRPSGLTSGERRDQILHMVQAASPNSKTFDSYRDEIAAYRAFTKLHQGRIERGVSAYPKFPFVKLNEKLGSMFPGNPMLISAGTKRGKCVVEGTLIPTETGMVPIEKLMPAGTKPDECVPMVIGVQTPEGFKYTSHFYNSGMKATRKITTRFGYQLAGTYNHPVLTIKKDGSKVWTNLEDIQTGDYVAVQRHDAVFGSNTKLPDFKPRLSLCHPNTKNPIFPETLDDTLAYVLGLLVGNGGLTKGAINFSTADSETLSRYRNWINSLGLELRQSTSNPYDYYVRNGNYILKQWLENIGLKSVLSAKKEIPEIIMQAPKDYVRAFLQGLFDTDGSAYMTGKDAGYIDYCSASEKLARQVHILLLQFGIVANLRFKENDKSGAWLVTIRGDARLFYERIGFRLARKQQGAEIIAKRKQKVWADSIPCEFHVERKYTNAQYRALGVHGAYFRGKRQPGYEMLKKMAALYPELEEYTTPEYFWDKVQYVEESGIRQCYDMTVPGPHAFVSNGIVSHNSLMAAVLAEWFAYTQGVYVLLITLESDVEQWERRWWARHFGIPQKAWLGDTEFKTPLGNSSFETTHIPQIDLRHPYWAELVSEQRVTEYLQRLNVAGGRLVLERTPGWSITALKKRVMEHLRIAERLGLPLMVFVDYIQKSAWMNLGKERELDLITRYSNEWKLLAEKTQMYSIMFSQESGDAGDGVKGYGSRIPHTVFQQYVSIQRPQLGSKKPPVPVIEEKVLMKDTEHLRDAFGRLRFYARNEGDFSGRHAYLDIIASNDGERGKVPILIEGGMSNITDPDAPQFIQNHSGERFENPWAVRRYDKVDFSKFT